MSVIDYFSLSLKEAKEIVAEVSKIILEWKKTAKQIGIGNTEIEQMASAFQAFL
jgi:hypothetical protein